MRDVFNLRARIFETAARAVVGERVIIRAVRLEEPLDYDDEAVNVRVRAAQTQALHGDYFKPEGQVPRPPFLPPP